MTFDEIQIGQTETLSHTITKDDVHKFIDITNDDNAIHTTNKYGQPIVHGMLTASFISTIIGTKIPGDGALWFSQTLDFVSPVRVGDKLDIKATVKDKDKRENVIILNVEIQNQKGRDVIRGESKIKVMEEKNKKEEFIPLKEKSALVVGGTGGIGREVLAELTHLGFKTTITYYTNSVLASQLKGEYGCEIVHMDALYDNVKLHDGNFDVLVNCIASPLVDRPIEKIDRMDIDEQMEYNLYLNIELVQTVCEYMKEQKYGKIIFIGSKAMDIPRGHWLHYIVAKEALWGLTKALSYELAPRGIRVNMVSPNLIDTKLTADISPKMKLITHSQSPLRKPTTAREVAKTIGFLASHGGDAITGQNIRING